METYRQVVLRVPRRPGRTRGPRPDVNAVAHAYGTDVGPLRLLLSSSHPRHAGVMNEAERLLRAAGARESTRRDHRLRSSRIGVSQK